MMRIRQTGSKSPDKYHTDSSCRHYPEDGRDITAEEAEDRDLDECMFCSGEFTPNKCDSYKYHRLLVDSD